MRRLTMALLVGSLLSIGGGPAVVAQSPSPDPVGLGGRVELPEYGFALTFPDDWAWVRYTTEDFDSVMEQLADLTSPEFVAANEDWFDGMDSETPLEGERADSASGCLFQVIPMDLPFPLDMLAPAFIENIQGRRDIFPDGATLTDVALPAGQSKRVDASQVDEGWVSPMEQSHYLLVRGSRFYDITCMSHEPPEDRWLSIAETLEFLPAAE